MFHTLKTNPYRFLHSYRRLSTSPDFCNLFTFAKTRSYHHTVFPLLFHEDFQQLQLPQLLQACSRAQSLDTTKSLHGLIITMGSDQPIFVNNNLVSAYASLGELSFARLLFDKMTERNTVSYNSIIVAYSRHGNGDEAWNLFYKMMGAGFSPTQFTFGSLLSSSSFELHQGFQLQVLILKTGLLYANVFSGTALLGLFGRHGRLDEALKLFEEMPCRNIVTWNSIISISGQCGFVEKSMILFREFLNTELLPSEHSFVGVLSGFRRVSDLESGEQIHGLVIKTGAEFYPSVVNSLINMYAKCSGTDLAEKVFEEIHVQDEVSWNIIIGTFAKSENPEKALELFVIMPWHGILPNQTTFASVISSCVSLQIPAYGRFIHAKTIKKNFESDIFVGSALVDFYAKCNNMEEAYLCFDEINEKNVVSWNALISGYSIKGTHFSVYLLREMLHSGQRPNQFSFSSALKASSAQELQQLHGLILRMGYHQNEYVSSSLIASYAFNGLISDALTFATTLTLPLPIVSSNIIAGIYNKTGRYLETQNLLSQLKEPDMVSWNILIAACARSGHLRDVFELFKNMQMAQIQPDNYTYMSLFSICSKLCNLSLGSALHALIIKINFERCDIFVCNVLVNMYAKCGSLENSVKVFNEMMDRNLFSWTALISALGVHGFAHEALERFREMEILGFKPDGVAFNAVLSACRHGGLVEEGLELFRQMKGSYGVEPDMYHYLCMVDLLARFGHLKEAEQMISSMPFQPNALIWRSFLEGCKRYSDEGEQEVGREKEVRI